MCFSQYHCYENRRSVFLFLFALAARIVFSLPQESDTLRNRLLDEVVVTARTHREVIQAQRLSGRELEALNSYSVADAIRYFSGVQLKDYGGVGGLKTVNIRSMGSNQVGVFYNGVQLGNAQNGQVDLGKFSMDNVETISLYNGQRSRLLQSARDFSSASSIYITTRRPQFVEGRSTNVRATIKCGSFDLINPSLLMEYRLSDRVSLSFNGEWLNSSGKYKVRYRRVYPHTDLIAYDTTAVRENGDINATRMEASLHGLLSKGNWTVNAYNYSSDRGVPGAVVNNVWRRGERMRDVNSFVQGSLTYDLHEVWRTLTQMKYAADYTHFENFDYSLYPTNNKFRQKEFYLSSAHLFSPFDRWELSASYDFQWNTLDADMQRMDDYDVFPYPTRFTHWFSVGSTLDWHRLKVQANLLGTVVHESVRRSAAPEDKNVLTPALFLSYRLLPFERFYLNTFYKKIFRVATFNEMYYVEMQSSNIRPEYATQYNVGLKYSKEFYGSILRQLDAQVDLYYNEVKDKIICTPKSPMFKWTTYNLGLVQIRGVDLSVGHQSKIEKVQLATKLQYTYQRAADRTDPTDTFYGHQIPYIPWHSGSAIASIGYGRFSLNYSFIYTGERYSQSDNIVYNHVQPWYTHDVSLVGLFRINKSRLKATLEVNNLLGQDYEVIFNYPMPKRNFRLTLSIEL